MASWVWQSILASRLVVEKGWGWQVATGSQIEIWKDPWLADPIFPKILMSNPYIEQCQIMSDLELEGGTSEVSLNLKLHF